MALKPVEILCSACGADALLVRRARYDGFARVGDILTCSACGHEFASEGEVPFKEGPRRPRVFTADDASRKVEVFRADEKGRTCRYCRHYVVNPFTQRCGLSFRKVEATDTCGEFAPLEDGKPQDKPPLDGTKSPI